MKEVISLCIAIITLTILQVYIKFKSLKTDIILKNRLQVFTQIRPLIKDLYKSIKTDLLNNNLNIDLSKYKDELKHILIITYRKLYIKNIKMTDNIETLNVKSINKIGIEDNQKSEINEIMFNRIDSLIDKTSKERAGLLIASISDSIDNIKSLSDKSYLFQISEITKEIQDINTRILNFTFKPSSNELSKQLYNLKKEKQRLENLRIEIQNQKQQFIKNSFNRKYQEEVVDIKSETHSLNEIDNFDSLQQKEESNIIDDFFKFTLLIDTQGNKYKNEENDKTWISQLDRTSRNWHAREHGTTIKESEYFELQDGNGNIETCLAPRDYSLSAYNSINCRCTLERTKVFRRII